MEPTHPHNLAEDDPGIVLLLQVPRTNEKKELAAEQMFASLHGLLTTPAKKGFFKTELRERISFEIAVLKKRIGFYVWVPTYLENYVEEQMYAQYPSVHISQVPDYSRSHQAQFTTTLAADLRMTAADALPIKTFQSFEVDPLAAITATLAKFEDDEEAWIQMVIRPASSGWHRKSERYANSLRNKGGGTTTTGLLSALWAPPETKTEVAKLTDYEQIRANSAEEKAQKLAFEASIRIVYRGNSPEQIARLKMQSIIASYKQFNTTYLNGFEAKRVNGGNSSLGVYAQRTIQNGFLCNIEETATLFHLPHTNVETPYILWASSQTAEPPATLPIVTGEQNPNISPIAATNFRGHNTMFGMPRADRSRHLYIIGQTGVGKSGLLELLTISDVYSPYGFAIIDPHGDYAINILKRIPASRATDVIYFNPADTDYPIAFNPMEVNDPKLKNHTCSELIGVLKRMFESWGPRLEYILRYSILALLDYPEATMLDITRVLTDKKFRAEVLTYVQDPVVRNFWQIEFSSWNDKFAAEAVAPVLNKVGAFTANPLVRNIIGQPKSSFNIRKIMDERKIMIVNLSRGLVGEDNAALLGALLVTKIQLAAMSRADIGAEERSPFYLYVDEFQNFATDSFATILSEARKYGLNLTVANQYTAQMLPQVKDAVFGNVGSIIGFRMSADDATTMTRYFEPKFEAGDLVHMHNRNFVISMTIDGEKVQAFSAISLNLPPQGEHYMEDIINHSRAQYGSSREYVEKYVDERYLTSAPAPQPSQQRSQKPRPKLATPATAPKPAAPATDAHAPKTQPIQGQGQTQKPFKLARIVVDKAMHPGQSLITKTLEKTPEVTVDLRMNIAGVESPAPPPKKRKRTRRRKKSSAAQPGQPTAKQIEETIINLK